MPNEFPIEDPRKIWQQQPTEKFKMSTEEIRNLAQEHRTKARLRAVFSIAIGVVLGALFARSLVTSNELVSRIGFGLLCAYCIYFIYQAYRWTWPPHLGPDATASASLHYYRSELERSRDYGQHIWRRAGLTFLFLSMAVVLAPGLIGALKAPRLLWNFAPVVVLLIIWLVLFLRGRKRQRAKLQQKIDELRGLE